MAGLVEKEMAAIIETCARTSWVIFEDQVGILIRLGFGSLDRLRRKIIQESVVRDYARGIFQSHLSLRQNLKLIARRVEGWPWRGLAELTEVVIGPIPLRPNIRALSTLTAKPAKIG